MHIELAWWFLTENDPQPKKLRAQLDESVHQQWRDVKNLAAKWWLESSQPPGWGALTIWDGKKPALSSLPKNLSAQWIGRPADQHFSFKPTVCTLGEQSEAWLAQLIKQMELFARKNTNDIAREEK